MKISVIPLFTLLSAIPAAMTAYAPIPGLYTLDNVEFGRAMDVDTTDNISVHAYSPHHRINQQWEVFKDGPGPRWKFQNLFCRGYLRADNAENASVYVNTTIFYWGIVIVDDGIIQLYTPNTTWSIEAKQGDTSELELPIQLATWSNDLSQQWKLTPVVGTVTPGQ